MDKTLFTVLGRSFPSFKIKSPPSVTENPLFNNDFDADTLKVAAMQDVREAWREHEKGGSEHQNIVQAVAAGQKCCTSMVVRYVV